MPANEPAMACPFHTPAGVLDACDFMIHPLASPTPASRTTTRLPMANFFPIFALTLPPKVRSYPSGPQLSDHYLARTGTPSKVSARFVPGREIGRASCRERV